MPAVVCARQFAHRDREREREREREGERCVVLVAPPIDDPLLKEAEDEGGKHGGESEETRGDERRTIARGKREPAPEESRKSKTRRGNALETKRRKRFRAERKRANAGNVTLSTVC